MHPASVWSPVHLVPYNLIDPVYCIAQLIWTGLPVSSFWLVMVWCSVATIPPNICPGPKIYSELGYSTVKQLIFQCGWNTVGLLGTIIAAAIMDIFGRKPLVVAGMAGCCVCLVIEAAMVAAYAGEGTNKAGLEMGVAATYIFILFQTFSFDSAGLVMLGEIFPNHSRARGLALVIAVVALTDLVYLEVTDTVNDSPTLCSEQR